MSDSRPVPFVSVVVPVKDDEGGLRTCLQHLEQQDYPEDRFEVLVVDNGSRRPPADAVADAAHARLLHEPRPGSYAARNRGLQEAVGEVIAFTDADCMPRPGWLASGVAILERDAEVGLVAGRIDVVPADAERPRSVELVQVLHAFPQQRYVAVDHFGATANVFTRRAVIDAVGTFDASLASGGDKEWGRRVHAGGWRLVHADDAVVLHPARPSWREYRRKLDRVFAGELAARARRGEGPGSVGALSWRSLVPPVGSVLRHLGDPRLRPVDRPAYAWGATVARWSGTLAGHRARRRAARAGPGGTWGGLVVVCAGTFYNGHRLADQHVADRLVELGVPVLYVDPPLSPLGARRDEVRSEAAAHGWLRLERPGLARLTPLAPPGKTRWPLSLLTDALLRRQVARACRALTGDVRAVLSVGGRDVLGRCGERHSVFWARDDFAAGAQLMNLPASRVRAQEERAAARADLVLAVSPSLERRWQEAGRRTALVPNGCDATALASVPGLSAATDVRLPPPVLGVVGTIGTRIDLRLLEAVVDRGWSLLLVGQRQKNLSDEAFTALLARPCVQWVGHRAWSELPSYLRAVDVGLVPYADTAFNRASFPLKTLEYLAAGLPVVSTGLPATRWLDTDLVATADGVDAFCDAVEAVLAAGSSPDDVARRQRFAAQHDWTTRAHAILDLLP